MLVLMKDDDNDDAIHVSVNDDDDNNDDDVTLVLMKRIMLWVPETERCFELSELSFKVKKCQKNPGHSAFHAVSSFGLLNLPPDCRDQRVVHYLRLFSRLAVKLTSLHTSRERQGAYKLATQSEDGYLGPRRLASGFAWLPNETSEMPCPIQNCPYSSHPHNVYGYIRVITNKHVVYDEDEAMATQGEFWDEEVRGIAYSAPSRRVAVQCVGLDFSQEDKDAAHLKCVTHDHWLCEDLKREISELRERYSRIPLEVWEGAKDLCVTVSHPHGMLKMITIGRHISVKETSTRSHAHYHTCSTCPGSSGAPMLHTSSNVKGALPMWLPAIHSYYCPSDDLNCAFK
ncbi:hypothetical protein ElyMa_005229800 [Elysia marginata]|uniref:Peptidase S1 domain-containing protein n=1 Tax=Elysia marginata TaxID=1093978 RepID=A0AAV4K125_9GAST|nr:hypothetical protein ElyMa_005229800 [Elysia marginata]